MSFSFSSYFGYGYVRFGYNENEQFFEVSILGKQLRSYRQFYKCKVCQKRVNEKKTETFGGYYFCHKCAIRATNAPAPDNDNPIALHTTVETSNKLYSGGYDWETGDMHIEAGREEDTCHLINHEFMHRIIHRVESNKASSMYDSIKRSVDPYVEGGV